jgi:hypothetical protein
MPDGVQEDARLAESLRVTITGSDAAPQPTGPGRVGASRSVTITAPPDRQGIAHVELPPPGGEATPTAFTVTVLPGSDPPRDRPSGLQGTEDRPLEQRPPATGVEKGPRRFTIVDHPANGTVELTDAQAGQFTYRPKPAANETDRFVFTVTDGAHVSDAVAVVINVAPVERLPVEGRLTSDTAFPAMAGTPITFRGSAAGGCEAFEYKFRKYKPGSGWTVVQDFGGDDNWTWTPRPEDSGDYVVQLWVRCSGSTSSYDAYAAVSLSVVRPIPTLESVTSSAASPVAPGSPITWTANASGGLAPLEFKFWRYRTASGWTMARDWGASNTLTWTPGTADEGDHTLQVWVRNAGATGGADAWRALEFTVGRSAPQIHAVTANRAFPASAGTPITWTVSASGGTSGPLRYRFWRYNGATWTLARDYSADPTYTWTPGRADAGDHLIQVWVRSAGSSASHEVFASTGYFKVVILPVTVTSFAADRTSPASTGTPITFKATASGGTGPLEYRFWRFKAGTGWTLLRDYGAARSVALTPGPGDVGVHALQVWVRVVGSASSHDAYAAIQFVVQ